MSDKSKPGARDFRVSTYIDPGVYIAQVDDSALEPEPTLWVLRWWPQGEEHILNATLTYSLGAAQLFGHILRTADIEEVCSQLFFPGRHSAVRIELLRAGEAERYTVFSMDNVRDVLKRVRGEA